MLLQKQIGFWGALGATFWCSVALAATNPQEVDPFDEIHINLAAESIVEHSHYKLSEIAHIEGFDPVFMEKLVNVVIGRSPLPGGSLVVTQSLIRSKLRPYIDAKYLVFAGAERAKIRRSALRISGEDIEQAVLNHIEQEMQGVDIKTKLLAKSRDIFLPKGELDFEIKSRGKYKKEGGYRTYEVAFHIGDKLVKKVPVRVYVKIYKDVYVAKDTIKRNHKIEEGDLKKVRKNVERLPKNYVTDKSILVGKVAKRAINPQEVLHNNAFTTPPLVNTGDQVLIVYETASLRLTAPGVAMQKGRLGQRIPVRNTATKTLVQATVKQKNLVQVN